MQFTIEIPADCDGYVLFRCPLCGEFFKLTAKDYKDDTYLELRCPYCGIVSKNYFTNGVYELALTKTENYAMDLIYGKLKSMERELKSGFLSFDAGSRPTMKYESPVTVSVEALSIYNYKCCGKMIKLKPLSIIIGSYCPFCGVREYGDE